MVGLIICTVLGYYALIYSVKNACKSCFYCREKLILSSESTKFRALHRPVRTNYTGSVRSYVLGVCAAWNGISL